MGAQSQHMMLARKTREEKSRDDLLIDFKLYLTRDLGPYNKKVYEDRAVETFRKKHKRDPETRHEVAEVMNEEPFYQMWSALGRIQQELYIDTGAACVERQLPQLLETAKSLSQNPKYGTLTLEQDFPIPRYQRDADIHCVPGGYYVELTDDDIYAGARYDIGSFVYGRGKRGPLNDERGRSGVEFLKENFPNLNPKKILDLGCGPGINTPPYVDAFPDAEVYAVDLAAPLLRYAHARAEGLEKPIHFSQQNAEKMNFEDESFDLITSHILFHESSKAATQNFIKECYRLLKPGGLMVHLDVPTHLSSKTPFEKFMSDWDTLNNNEPFWGALLFDVDMVKVATDAGFKKESVVEKLVSAAYQKRFNYWAYYAIK